jgi:hypothetical protein
MEDLYTVPKTRWRASTRFGVAQASEPWKALQPLISTRPEATHTIPFAHGSSWTHFIAWFAWFAWFARLLFHCADIESDE